MKYTKKIILFFMLVTMIFSISGCDFFKEKSVDTGNSEMTISNLKEEYEYENLYLDPMYNLEKDHVFEINFKADISGTKVPGKIAQVYSSPDFSKENKIDVGEERKGHKLIITPPDVRT